MTVWGSVGTLPGAHSPGRGQEASEAALPAGFEAARILRLMCAIAQKIQLQRLIVVIGAWVFLPDQHL
jgi:hypothetical protein